MPVPPKRRLVADALRDAIATGRYVPGQRLPGEHDLAERFAVSRGTVRAALADLADEEYIAIRGGIGSVVTFDGAALDPGAAGPGPSRRRAPRSPSASSGSPW